MFYTRKLKCSRGNSSNLSKNNLVCQITFCLRPLSLSLYHHVARPNALHSISQVVASVDDVLPVSGNDNDNEYTHIAHTPASPSLIAMFVVCLSICI